MVILGANQDGNSCLVETPALTVPLLDAVESTLARQVEHEKDGYRVVADEGQHVDELALAAQIPDTEGDFGVPDADSLFHEVYTEGLDVVLVPATLDIFDHEGGLADLRVTDHPDLDHDMITAVRVSLV